jgi:hypothetical protein
LAAVCLTLTFASLACQIQVGGPTPAGPPIPVSTEAASDLADAWTGALLASAASGQVTLIVSETQLTSYLALRLAQSENPILDDPQVHLRDGTIQVYGRSVQGPFEANVRISLAPTINAEGELGFAISSADFGPLPVPEALASGTSALLTEAFTGSLGSLATGIRITTLAIADGQLAIVGEVR